MDFKVISERVVRADKTVYGDPHDPWRFWVDVVDKEGRSAFRSANDGILRDQVLDWCNKNCSMPALVGGLEMVCFQNEEDAILFWMTFK